MSVYVLRICIVPTWHIGLPSTPPSRFRQCLVWLRVQVWTAFRRIENSPLDGTCGAEAGPKVQSDEAVAHVSQTKDGHGRGVPERTAISKVGYVLVVQPPDIDTYSSTGRAYLHQTPGRRQSAPCGVSLRIALHTDTRNLMTVNRRAKYNLRLGGSERFATEPLQISASFHLQVSFDLLD